MSTFSKPQKEMAATEDRVTLQDLWGKTIMFILTMLQQQFSNEVLMKLKY